MKFKRVSFCLPSNANSENLMDFDFLYYLLTSSKKSATLGTDKNLSAPDLQYGLWNSILLRCLLWVYSCEKTLRNICLDVNDTIHGDGF